MKAKTTRTAFLWWLIGAFGLLGLHRVYLGRVGSGVAYFFTGGVFFIGAVLDAFRMGSLVDRSNAARLTAGQLQLRRLV